MAEVVVIEVEAPTDGSDATASLNEAIARAAGQNGAPTEIRLAPGDYNISREHSVPVVYHISNTASEQENPDPTKHVGLLMRGLSNVTFDGRGARLVTHGEMTTFVVDSCENITLKNFTLTAADPSVVEIRATGRDSLGIDFEVVAPTRFDIVDGRLQFEGDGWTLRDGHAQVFYPERNVTLRVHSPLSGYAVARRIGERAVKIEYAPGRMPEVNVGEVYQIRHGIRNEVCAFINRSRDVMIANAELNFLGNFGLVGQFSENITYDNIRCRPAEGRTNAGFADFVQMSGCKGKIKIVDSYFEGSQDDPINIHGTHLKVVEPCGAQSGDADRLRVRYSHPQTFGFQPYCAGDSIDIVDCATLNAVYSGRVVHCRPIDDYDYELTFDEAVPAEIFGEDLAVENTTWTPEVEIRGNYFARTPTRGILITTRRKSVIEDNIFFRIPMASILVSDDARSWYESGPVRDLTIRGNRFVECSDPVILIKPETTRPGRPVHTNIRIEDNIQE